MFLFSLAFHRCLGKIWMVLIPEFALLIIVVLCRLKSRINTENTSPRCQTNTFYPTHDFTILTYHKLAPQAPYMLPSGPEAPAEMTLIEYAIAPFLRKEGKTVEIGNIGKISAPVYCRSSLIWASLMYSTLATTPL